MRAAPATVATLRGTEINWDGNDIGSRIMHGVNVNDGWSSDSRSVMGSGEKDWDVRCPYINMHGNGSPVRTDKMLVDSRR